MTTTMTENEARLARRAFARFFTGWIDYGTALGLFSASDIIASISDAADSIGFFPVENFAEEQEQERIDFESVDGERISLVEFDDGRLNLVYGNDDEGIKNYEILRRASRWETEED